MGIDGTTTSSDASSTMIRTDLSGLVMFSVGRRREYPSGIRTAHRERQSILLADRLLDFPRRRSTPGRLNTGVSGQPHWLVGC